MAGRTHFAYTPPGVTNVALYAVALTGAIWFLAARGDAAWAWLVATLGLTGAVVGFGFAVYMTWFWLLGGGYLALDRFEAPRWLYRYKIQTREAGARRHAPALSKAVRVVLTNQVLGTLPFLVLVYVVMRDVRGVDLAGPLPAFWVMALQLAGCVLVEEVLFYAAHRALHTPTLFRRFHRVHHEYHESVGIATHYVHFVEHVVGNLLPVFAGPILLGVHPLVMLLWVVFAVTNAIVTHSGYAIPWLAWSVEHDFHHWNVRGSYGAVGILDNALGTGEALKEMARRHANAGSSRERETRANVS